MAEFIITILVVITLWLFVTSFKRRQRKVLLAQMPSENKMAGYITRLGEMRAEGAGYHAQLDYLLGEGVNRKIADSILAEVEKRASS